MNFLRRYFTLLSVLLLMRLVTACNGSSGPSGTDQSSGDPTGCVDDDSGEIDDDDSGGDDEDEPGDVDCEDDDD